MRKAMEKADFKSVRGDFKFGNNHIPIQNFYLQDAGKNADGSYALHTVRASSRTIRTSIHDKCPMQPRQSGLQLIFIRHPEVAARVGAVHVCGRPQLASFHGCAAQARRPYGRVRISSGRTGNALLHRAVS